MVYPKIEHKSVRDVLISNVRFEDSVELSEASIVDMVDAVLLLELKFARYISLTLRLLPPPFLLLLLLLRLLLLGQHHLNHHLGINRHYLYLGSL